MALERTFGDLRVRLQKLYDALFSARMTVVEDRPLLGDTVLVDQFGDALEDALGWLEEILSEAGAAEQALSYPTDTERARHALTTCQARFNLLLQRLGSEATSYRRLAELTELGRNRRAEWQAWAESARDALEQCQPPLYEVNNALFACWQDLVGMWGAVSVQATNIGQQITVPNDRELAREGAP